MGYKLANAAYELQLGGVISDRARVALDHMCRHARDVANEEIEAGVYNLGWQTLAICLVGVVKGGSEAGRKSATRAVRELLDAGLIEQVKKAGLRQTASYRITFGGELNGHQPVDNSAQDGLPMY